MDRGELELIWQGLERAKGSGQRAALCTVVRVRGSAYRREGAKMLVLENGDYVCMLSGGCLEAEVALAAQEVIADGQARIVSYDLSEEVVWGLGIGCGGSVDVLIERLDTLLEAWLEALRIGALSVTATVLTSDSSIQRVTVTADGRLEGNVAPALQSGILNIALEMIGSLYPRSITRRVAGLDVFFDASSPPPALVVFGAGHDAVPLVARALEIGWAVSVIDSRSAFLTSERFGAATLVNPGVRFEFTLPDKAFCIVMNHHLERDRSSLRFALEREVAFIGVLGPRTRYMDMLQALREDGFTPTSAQLERVRNPIGLNIGAESPAEVALSVMSELVAVRRGFAGGVLNGLEGRIHAARG